MVVVLAAEALYISGGSAPSGKLSTILAIFSLTSFAATSRSISRSNSKVIVDLPSSLVESIVTIPGVPPILSSIF